MKTYYIIDLDGTLFNNSHRLHLLPKKGDIDKGESWERFNKACVEDTPIKENVARIERDMRFLNGNPSVIFLTGRTETCRKETRMSLENDPATFGLMMVYEQMLVMRKYRDYSKSSDYKLQSMKKLVKLFEQVAKLSGESFRIRYYDDDLEAINKIESSGICGDIAFIPFPSQDVSLTLAQGDK